MDKSILSQYIDACELIKETEEDIKIEREIKLADKIKALELLGKHLGMYQNNLNVTIETSTFRQW